ncbi:MAG: hypothetical protein ACE5H3_09985, partial [Planctomycetota bacterium]
MKALLVATGFNPGRHPMLDLNPGPLLPLAGKPFLQHILEYLVQRGVREFHLLLHHRPERVEEALGSGQRWGCRIRYRIVDNPETPLDGLNGSFLDGLEEEEPFLLGRADFLPDLPQEPSWRNGLLFDRPGGSPEGEGKPLPRWSGWAILGKESLAGLRESTEEELSGKILAFFRNRAERVVASNPLDLRTWRGLLEANHAVITGRFSGLSLPAREVEPGIWIARNVALHPRVRLEAPVFIGEDCSIGSGVSLGPTAIVSSGCILANRTRVATSVLCPDTYIGESLVLRESVVDRDYLVSVTLGTGVPLKQGFLIGRLDQSLLRGYLYLLAVRGLAAMGTFLLLPAALLCFLLLFPFRKGGPVIHRKKVVRLPAGSSEGPWKTFSLASFGCAEKPPSERNLLERILVAMRLDQLPALPSIFMGCLHFVGLPPRTPAEVESLPGYWRTLYLEGKAGLATLGRIHSDAEA